jgi:hypothetical protein
MTGWRQAYDSRNWEEVETWWQACDDFHHLQALLDQLRRDVPRLRLENGMEKDARHVFPEEAPEAWRGGAEILFLGELEAKAFGDPADEVFQWEDLSANTAAMMRGFISAQEVTEGYRALSRSAHAEAALELLETIEREAAAMSAEIDPDGTNPSERSWLMGVIGQAAVAAFKAGVHARAAAGKEIEHHAVRGNKVLKGTQSACAATAAANRPKRKALLAEINRLIALGHTKSDAARLASKKGLGTSFEANRKALYRAEKAQK